VLYRHEQIGRIYVVLLLVAFPLMIVAFVTHYTTLALAFDAILVVASIAFARLSIEVDASGLRWGMTFGFPSGSVALDEIASAEIVPISFWAGIGIHLTLRGWVWNVALGQGVEIHRNGAPSIILGTDAPEALLDAIDRARAA